MAAAFRSKTWGNSGMVGTEPAGASANDILFLWVLAAGGTLAPPAGWSTFATWTGTNSRSALYWIRRSGSAPSYTWSGGTGYLEWSVTCWSGCETSGNPWNASASNATTQRNPDAPDCPSITTTVVNTVVVAFGMGWNGSSAAVWQPPSGYTIREDGVGIGSDLCVASKAVASASTENPAAFTTGAASLNDVAEATIALMEPQTAADQIVGYDADDDPAGFEPAELMGDVSAYDFFTDCTANRADEQPPIPVELPSSFEWEDVNQYDDAIWPSYWAQPPPNDDLPQQGIYEDGQYFDPEEEPYGFENNWPTPANDLPQQAIVEEAGPQLEDVDEPFDFYDAPVPGDVVSDQVFTEDSDSQQDDQDELEGFADAPAPADIQSDQVFVEDSDAQFEDEESDGFTHSPLDSVIVDPPGVYDGSEQQEDPDEPFGFADDPLSGDVTNQLSFVPLGFDFDDPDQPQDFFDAPFEIAGPVLAGEASDQLEDADEAFDFTDAPLAASVVADLPYADPGDQIEDADEFFGFELGPLPDDVTNQLNFSPLAFDYDSEQVEGFADGPLTEPVIESNQVFVSDSSTQIEDVDEPENFAEAPLSTDQAALGQLYFVPLQFDFNDPDEPQNFAEGPLSADIAPIPNQLYFVPLAYDFDADDTPKESGFEYQPPADDAVVESNQVFIEDASNQLEFFDEPLDWLDAPASADVFQEDRENDESSDEQNLDDEEDFGFDLPPLPTDVHNQIIVVMAGSNYDDPDHPEGFFDGPLAVDPVIESNQVFVEDAADQLEDFDEPENFVEWPLAPDAVVQSDQVVVEDGAWVQEDEQAPQDFADAPAPADVFITNQIFFVSSVYDYEDKETYEGFAADPLAPDLVIESDQVFVEDGSNFDVEADVEDFAFFDAPGVPELVIESDQVFVEDALDWPEEEDESRGFVDTPTPDDVVVVVPPVVTADGSSRSGSGGGEPTKKRKPIQRRAGAKTTHISLDSGKVYGYDQKDRVAPGKPKPPKSEVKTVRIEIARPQVDAAEAAEAAEIEEAAEMLAALEELFNQRSD